MAGRAKQMEDLKAKREEEEARYKGEVAKLKEDWKEYLREVEAEKATMAQKQAAYRSELDCQTQYNNIRQVGNLKRLLNLCITCSYLSNIKIPLW